MTRALRLAAIRAAHRRHLARERQVDRVVERVDMHHAEPVSDTELGALLDVFEPSVRLSALWEALS